jgi:uncharacterized protein YecT (DUF1311 family)
MMLAREALVNAVEHAEKAHRTLIEARTRLDAARPSEAPCNGDALSGVFKVIPGSAGAGNISYQLKLQNVSQTTCFVSGVPGLQLLDKQGTSLPTNVTLAQPGKATAAKLTLAPGASVVVEARFSPDVPGTGEPTDKQCEPTAYWLQVSPQPGTGTLKAPVKPPTPVCEKGTLNFRLPTAGPPAAGGSYSSCLKNAPTTADMQACITTELKRVDAKLNEVYKQLIAVPGVDKKALIKAENAWIGFRDSDCKFVASLNAGGSIATINQGDCLITKTTARTRELQSYLKQAKG